MQARAYWTVAPGRGEIRAENLPEPGPEDVLVRTLRTGISRGTETLVHTGAVPASIRAEMRAPFQSGDLPGPVKYGYLSVGVVEAGPDDLRGSRVFCLHPHQDRYLVPADQVVPVPDPVSDDRAVLAGAVETALNGIWEAAPRYGDRIAVVGAGMIGAAVASLLRHFPLDRLQLVDLDPTRSALAAAFGVDFVSPAAAAGDCDIVLHCSATGAGLARGLDLLGVEGELIEMSWYGVHAPQVPLGEAFHSRRLSLRSSQVGAVAAARRSRRTNRDRLATALEALADPAYDVLLTGSSPFEELPDVMDEIAAGRRAALCHVVTYDGTPGRNS